MTEYETKVQLVRVDCSCEKCRVGLLKPTGKMLTVLPPQYELICQSCGETTASPISYPYYKYIDME